MNNMQYAATKVIGMNPTIVLAVILTEVDQTCASPRSNRLRSAGCVDDIIRLQPGQNKKGIVDIIP